MIAALAFALLFHEPARTLVRDWLSDPDAGHGLLLAPLAFYLAWKRGLLSPARPQPLLGVFLLTAAVLLRYGSGLAAELFTMRASMIGAIMGLIVYVYGVRQLLHWWLPVALIILSIPLPDVVVGTLALPLQFKASQIGAALLEW
ncbi:MAG TPA: exosortase/archaeosortase family protein, partial [Steroidobacteraceae bacterium]